MQANNNFETVLSDYTNNKSYLTHQELISLKSQFDSEQSFFDALLKWVSEYAIAPISQFKVAALAIESGGEGRLFFGANLEFSHQALSLVVHAEQSAIHNALLHGVEAIKKLVINASPCGYCRQFINEIQLDKQPLINVHGVEKTIQQYLPDAFGPSDLDNHTPLFSQSLTQCRDLNAYVEQSYAPYSGNFSACQIKHVDGHQYFGVYLENAAYSPSLSPLQAALNQVQLHNRETGLHGISEIVIKQTAGKANQQGVANAVAMSLGSNIKVTIEEV
ncbi:MAG: cytidine deaminase [Pseudomonadota bacterium]|nr:cytidine deaminase [Pseudomonadota bacterium]